MNKFDQKVLCISAKDLRSIDGKRNGLQTKKLDKYISLLNQKGIFVRRGDAEDDPSIKQVIPQIILKYVKNFDSESRSESPSENTYFLHKQDNKISEQRLTNMYPLFLGGHVEEVDGMVGDKNLIENATTRELEEEATIGSKIISKEFKGIIYIEDGNFVNHVHIGLVWIYTIDGEDIEMNEEKLEKVGFVNKEYLIQKKEQMTYWSNIYVDLLD